MWPIAAERENRWCHQIFWHTIELGFDREQHMIVIRGYQQRAIPLHIGGPFMDDLDIPQNATPTLTGLDTPGADSPPLTGPAPSKRKVLTSEQREAKNAKAKARRAAKSNISTDSSPDSPAESDSTMSTSKKAKGKTAAPKKAKQTKPAKVAKPAKTAKKANAVKAKTNGHSAGPRGEKTKEIARLLQRKTGCTAA